MMAPLPATVHVFDAAERALFAALSGDVNPMHVNPVAARRTQAGAPVAHGMHLALWALDVLAGTGHIARPVGSLRAQFKKFVYDGETVALGRIRPTETALRASLEVGDSAVATVEVGFGTRSGDEAPSLSAQPVSLAVPAVLDLPDLPGRAGWLPATADEPIARAFPRLTERLGASRVEALARLSTLVGMVCPGLHSIFTAFSVRIADASGPDGMSFAVRDVDERFRRVEVAVSGGGIAGTVVAHLRHPPVGQRAMRDLSGLVAPDEFRGSTALVVGGSRGLGAATARLLVAGGGRVIVTYAVGEADAREVAAEIGPDACRVLRYDTRDDAAGQLARLEWEVNQLYYFATPQIFRQAATAYAPGRFAEFCRFYVDGFQATCSALLTRSGTPQLSAFYPSSVALESRPDGMTEYAMAKAAGEVLCADMDRSWRGLRVVVNRLPRVLTDQTATVMPVESSDAVAVMLPIIREVHAA